MAQIGNDHPFSNHRSNALSLRPGRHHIHAPSLRIGQSITDAVMINRRAPEKFEFSQKRCEDASHSKALRAKSKKGSFRFAIALGVRARLRAAFAGVAGALPRILSNTRLKRTFSACYTAI